MEFNARSPYANMRLKMSHAGEFKMPPVGITATRYSLSGRTYEKHSVRCDVEGCWFAGGALATRVEAEKYLADHKAGGSYSVRPCPAPPRRESLPSGLRHVEKLWRELDDAVECLATKSAYREGQSDTIEGERLAGYARGLAFAIVLLEPQHFPDTGSVSRHARDRRKMRLGEMDWAPTPTTLGHDARVTEVEGLHETGPAPKVTTTKSAKAPQVSIQVAGAIKAGLGSGMFSVAELAETYKLPIDFVESLRG
jgi:hypothetical protein